MYKATIIYLTLLHIIICGSFFALKAQNLKGMWVGSLVSDTVNVPVINTEYVLHVKEQNDNTVTGRAYVLEKKFAFEGILDFIGILNKGLLKITELRIISSRVPAAANKFLCIKLLDLKLRLTDSVDYLAGHWTGSLEDRTRCIPGMAYLTRQKPGAKNKIPDVILGQIVTDTRPPAFLNTTLSRPTVINVRNRTIQIEVSDYLKEDQDTISIYINRRLIIRNLKVVKAPVYRIFRMEANAGLQEIIIYAENLGKIPPNTSVLTINDGYKKQSVRIESTKEVSAVIYLSYQPPD